MRVLVGIALGLVGCVRCPDVERAPIRVDDRVADPGAVEATVRDTMRVFASWVGEDRMCFPIVKVSPDVWRDSGGVTVATPFIHDRVTVSSNPLEPSTILHELCHVLDAQEGISVVYTDFIEPVVDTGGLAFDYIESSEGFARTCELGPRNAALAGQVARACDLAPPSPLDLMMDDVVFGPSDATMEFQRDLELRSRPAAAVDLGELPEDGWVAGCGGANGDLFVALDNMAGTTVVSVDFGAGPVAVARTTHRTGVRRAAGIDGALVVELGSGVVEVWSPEGVRRSLLPATSQLPTAAYDTSTVVVWGGSADKVAQYTYQADLFGWWDETVRWERPDGSVQVVEVGQAIPSRDSPTVHPPVWRGDDLLVAYTQHTFFGGVEHGRIRVSPGGTIGHVQDLPPLRRTAAGSSPVTSLWISTYHDPRAPEPEFTTSADVLPAHGYSAAFQRNNLTGRYGLIHNSCGVTPDSCFTFAGDTLWHVFGRDGRLIALPRTPPN